MSRKSGNHYKSGLETNNGSLLKSKRIPFEYEPFRIKWKDERDRTYTPDFVMHNNIIVETKGRFVAADRRKHLEIRKQWPDLDIRFVFSNSNNKLYKGSKTTYAEWCIKNKFKFADARIPDSWMTERKKKLNRRCIK